MKREAMHPAVVRIVALVLSSSLLGCSSLQAIPEWRKQGESTRPSQAAPFKVGDEVRVSTVDRPSTTMVLTAIEADTLTGKSLETEKVVRIPFDQIVAIERRQFDALRTAGVVALVVIGLVVWALSQATFMAGG
jgi:hypothetical protein